MNWTLQVGFSIIRSVRNLIVADLTKFRIFEFLFSFYVCFYSHLLHLRVFAAIRAQKVLRSYFLHLFIVIIIRVFFTYLSWKYVLCIRIRIIRQFFKTLNSPLFVVGSSVFKFMLIAQDWSIDAEFCVLFNWKLQIFVKWDLNSLFVFFQV